MTLTEEQRKEMMRKRLSARLNSSHTDEEWSHLLLEVDALEADHDKLLPDAEKWRFLHLEAEEPLSCQMCRNAHDAVLKKLDEKEHRLIEAEKQLEQKRKQVEELQRECDNFERQILYTEAEGP